jgi:SAM-dependent methyltransferase
MPTPTTGQLGISEALRTFVSEAPYERRPILDFMIRAAREVIPGARVLDVGAGDAPNRELFDHVAYTTVDWEHSVHEDLPAVDITAAADDLPLDDRSFDAALLTQVLEHVAEPREVLAELYRVLRPGGRLYMTAPLVWELHELPFDYYRYTSVGLRHLLETAGFEQVEVNARNDCFTTVAQLMRNAGSAMGRAPDGMDERREEVTALLNELADQIAEFSSLDVERILPLGYSALATRPAAG